MTVMLNASSSVRRGGSSDDFHCAAESDTWCLSCDYVDPLSYSPQVKKAASGGGGGSGETERGGH